MTKKIFISYAHEEKPVADTICSSLEDQGLECWIAPRDIPYGMEYPEAIIQAIDNSRVLIVLFSSHANDSNHVKKEVMHASNKNVHIIPVRMENVQLSDTLEYFISAPNWLDATDGNIGSHIRRLAETIRGYLDPSSPVGPVPTPVSGANDEPGRMDIPTPPPVAPRQPPVTTIVDETATVPYTFIRQYPLIGNQGAHYMVSITTDGAPIDVFIFDEMNFQNYFRAFTSGGFAQFNGLINLSVISKTFDFVFPLPGRYILVLENAPFTAQGADAQRPVNVHTTVKLIG